MEGETLRTSDVHDVYCRINVTLDSLLFLPSQYSTVANERDEWVIGKMAASGPWVADSSALVALAVPPNHIFEFSNQEEEGEKEGSSEADGSSGGGSSHLGNEVKDGGSCGDADDDDEWSDCDYEHDDVNVRRGAKQEKEAKASQAMKAPAPGNAPTRNGFGAPAPPGNPGGFGSAFGARPMGNGFGAPPPAGNPGGGGGGLAVHVAQGLRNQQGAGVRARPLTETDPVEATTGIPLRDWTALLLLDDVHDDVDHDDDYNNGAADGNGSNRRRKSPAVAEGCLAVVAAPWIESVLAPLLAEYRAEKRQRRKNRRRAVLKQGGRSMAAPAAPDASTPAAAAETTTTESNADVGPLKVNNP